MSFSDLYVTRRTRKNHPLLAMEKLIDWVALDRVIHSHYAPVQMRLVVQRILGCCYSRCCWWGFGMAV